jgi:hypothetical protein
MGEFLLDWFIFGLLFEHRLNPLILIRRQDVQRPVNHLSFGGELQSFDYLVHGKPTRLINFVIMIAHITLLVP